MIEDSLLQEVRAAKDAYARSFGYDLEAIMADLRAKGERGNRPVVRLSPRRPDSVAGADRPAPLESSDLSVS